MLGARSFCLRAPTLLKSSTPVLRTNITIQKQPQHVVWRQFTKDSGDKITHAARRRTLKESLMAPAGDTAFGVGRGAVAGGAVVGLGALCYYGLGLSNQPGVIDQSV